MKDIDFDELDRAVNSLMSPKPVPSEEPDADVQVESEVAPANPEADAPFVEDANKQIPASDGISSEDDLLQTHEPQASPAPVASRGRFMDVMRPSSQEVKKAVPVSRQGITLQPSAEAMKGSTEETAPVEADAEQFDAVEDSKADAVSFGALMNDELSAGNTDTPLSPGSELADDALPLNSPFLPDAKVEKRPLGRPVSAPDTLLENTTATVPEPLVAPVDAADPISPNKDAQLPEQPLPPELDSELLSIETSAENLPTETVPSGAEEAPKPSAPAAPDPVSTPALAGPAVVSTSIPQQYKVEAPSSEEAPVNPIYDAQPLAHPAEKTPGWMWIVGILAILLIGVGGGAAIYYLGLL